VISRRLIERADYLLQREKGTVFKDPGGRVNICLVYPNTYRVGMSNLGFQGLYGILNSREDTVCERAFLPDGEDLEEFRRTGSELFSLESRRPLNRFDIIAFSVSYENDYPSIPLLLNLAKVPLLSAERDEQYPLVIAGGPCPTFNPEPIAEIFDLVFVGEADSSIHTLVECFRRLPRRSGFLKEISTFEGWYVPRFYRVAYTPTGEIRKRTPLPPAPPKIKKVTEKDLSQALKPAIITSETEFSGMYLLEAMRGCVWNCRFCLAGHIYNPPRQKEKEDLLNEIEAARTQADRIGLIGPSLTDYRHAITALRSDGVDFSITSLRASRRSAELLSFMEGKQSISIAPEAGTERLRRIINKRITEDDIIETSREIMRLGIKALRLYFMIGLPFERKEDIEGIISLARKIRSLSPRGLITLSVSTFVPKPFTPFQWHPMEAEGTVKERLKMLRKGLNQKGIRVFHDLPKYAYLQGLFARGDRRLTTPLLNMADPGRWRKIIREAGLSEEFYLFRKRDLDETLPWDFIDMGIEKKSLWKEYEKAREMAISMDNRTPGG
jgi:radical SAM superfamily enzyme YgiQ (UPF0313 family)